jgi:hypothetical protein
LVLRRRVRVRKELRGYTLGMGDYPTINNS